MESLERIAASQERQMIQTDSHQTFMQCLRLGTVKLTNIAPFEQIIFFNRLSDKAEVELHMKFVVPNEDHDLMKPLG